MKLWIFWIYKRVKKNHYYECSLIRINITETLGPSSEATKPNKKRRMPGSIRNLVHIWECFFSNLNRQKKHPLKVLSIFYMITRNTNHLHYQHGHIFFYKNHKRERIQQWTARKYVNQSWVNFNYSNVYFHVYTRSIEKKSVISQKKINIDRYD